MKAEDLKRAVKHLEEVERAAVCEAMQLKFISVNGHYWSADPHKAPIAEVTLRDGDPGFDAVAALLAAKFSEIKESASASLVEVGVDPTPNQEAVALAAADSEKGKRGHLIRVESAERIRAAKAARA
jgi:hypothetical protein